MGFNTVVLVLNDYMHYLQDCPHAVTWAITHPPHSTRDMEIEGWWKQVISVAREHNEPTLNLRGGLKVMPTFHADDKHIIIAGWNTLVRPEESIQFSYINGKKYATVLLPEWWSRE